MISNGDELIIVAGAGKGIGYSVTENLLSNHTNCAVLAISRNVNQLQELKKNHDNLIVFKADLSELSSADKQGILSLISQFRLKGLIFTAGILETSPIGEITKSLFNKLYQNNLWSFINLIQVVYPNINSDTHIVSIGSMGGFTGTLKFGGMSTYSSTKAALSSFTECLAEELKPIGASANCLMIGAVETEMMRKAFPNFHTNTTPSQIANFIVRFTLSDQKLFNGKVITVSSTIP